jgi:hypothetical protein
VSIRCPLCERRVTLLAAPSRTIWMASQDRESDRASTLGRVTRSEPRRLVGVVPRPNTKAIYCVAGRPREWRMRTVECREEGRDMDLLGVDDGNGSDSLALPLPLALGVLTTQNRERRMATGLALRFSSRWGVRYANSILDLGVLTPLSQCTAPGALWHLGLCIGSGGRS